MGRGDNRRTPKVKRHKARRRLKLRLKRKIAAAKSSK